MTLPQRLRSARMQLVAAAWLRALLWGAAIVLATLALTAGADAIVALPLVARALATWIGVMVAAVAAGVFLRRGARATSGDAALWIEERHPELRYALVTAAEQGSAGISPLGAVVERVRWEPTVRRAALRAVATPAAIALAALVAWRAMPAGNRARVTQSAATPPGALTGATAARLSRLAPLEARVVPPAYARIAASTIHEPSSIEALVGSRIAIRGAGDVQGLAATVGASALNVSGADGSWNVSLVMPAKASALRLTDGRDERLIVLVPRADSAPVVVLASPARDTVLRDPAGHFTLSARATDDIGLVSAAFELIVSSGEGENFTFRTSSFAAAAPNGATRADLRAAIALDTMHLKPGDILHIRAVARDGNTVSGPSLGSSETRVIRIARAGEYDSIAVEAAPPPDSGKTLLSERMLILQAEALLKKKPKLGKPEFLGESQGIGADQKALRREVGSIVFARLGGTPSGEETSDDELDKPLGKTPDEVLASAEASNRSGVGATLDFEGDETPVVAVNRPLLEAYNAMWDATRELEMGAPDRALPFMRAALDAIQRSRQADRIYLRGKPPTVVVDVNHVRLVGKDKGETNARSPRPAEDAAQIARADRLARAITLGATAPAAAIDSLVLLRVDALDANPSLAAALGSAIDAMRSGRDATDALVQARRLASGGFVASDRLNEWRLP